MRIFTGLALFVGLSIPALSFAAPPDHLAMNDLVNHPDRWPPTVTVNRDFRFGGGGAVHKGEKVIVTDFDGSEITAQNSTHDILFKVRPQECDFVDSANATWATLSPDQRALDARALLADRSLWPQTVTLRDDVDFNGNVHVSAGDELNIQSISAQGLMVSKVHSGALFNVDFNETDIFARARKTMATEKSKRPSQIIAALGANLIDQTGKHVVDDSLKDKQVFLLYFGGKRCPRCLALSPQFVKIVNDLQPKYAKLQVVLMGEDEEQPVMQQYMKDENMPFNAVSMKSRKQECPQFFEFTKGGGLLPEFVVVDRFGNVLKDSDDHRGHYDPDKFLADLPKFLDSQASLKS